MNTERNLWAGESSLFAVDDGISPPEPSNEGLADPGRAAEELEDPGDVLTVFGFTEINAANNARFRKHVCTSMEGHAGLEIDLSRTLTMDCAGLGALVALRNLAHERQQGMRLVNPTAQVQQFLQLVRAGEIFEIVNTRQADEG